MVNRETAVAIDTTKDGFLSENKKFTIENTQNLEIATPDANKVNRATHFFDNTGQLKADAIKGEVLY